MEEIFIKLTQAMSKILLKSLRIHNKNSLQKYFIIKSDSNEYQSNNPDFYNASIDYFNFKFSENLLENNVQKENNENLRISNLCLKSVVFFLIFFKFFDISC